MNRELHSINSRSELHIESLFVGFVCKAPVGLCNPSSRKPQAEIGALTAVSARGRASYVVSTLLSKTTFPSNKPSVWEGGKEIDFLRLV